MQIIDAVQNEEARLNALRDLNLLDTPPSESFDRLTRLASQLLGASVSTVSLTDRDRQWFKSKVGVDLAEIPREKAPCSYAIQGDDVLVVPDLKADPRFAESPLADAGIRFYAGAPLFTRAGHGLGTICVVDAAPRTISGEEKQVLKDLAGMVMAQIELQNMIGRLDATSGLPNQHQFFEDLEARAQRAAGESVSTVMVEFVSLAVTRRSVRVLGPAHADEFVQKALAIVQSALGTAAHLYHVGPMRCAILLSEASPTTGAGLVDALAEQFTAPISCGGVPLTPDPAFGLHEFAAGSVAPRDVLRRLIAACDDARDAEVPAARYDAKLDERHSRSFALVNDFAAALSTDDQLSLVYQPRIDIASGRLRGAEALLRWKHPRLGNISPGEFVPLIEQTALARPMTDWVARAVLAQTRAWSQVGMRLAISMNASALNLDERDFAGRLLRAINDAGVATEQLELEFTESAVARDATRVIEQLQELKQQGLSIAIDDFGTGYSNLAYIQQLPVSVLKIDRSFVQQLHASRRDRTLVRAMITMAHDLGYQVVAEGIETQEAYDILGSLNCDEGQGYLISRPVTPEAFSGWHESRLGVRASA